MAITKCLRAETTGREKQTKQSPTFPFPPTMKTTPHIPLKLRNHPLLRRGKKPTIVDKKGKTDKTVANFSFFTNHHQLMKTTQHILLLNLEVSHLNDGVKRPLHSKQSKQSWSEKQRMNPTHFLAYLMLDTSAYSLCKPIYIQLYTIILRCARLCCFLQLWAKF